MMGVPMHKTGQGLCVMSPMAVCAWKLKETGKKLTGCCNGLKPVARPGVRLTGLKSLKVLGKGLLIF